MALTRIFGMDLSPPLRVYSIVRVRARRLQNPELIQAGWSGAAQRYDGRVGIVLVMDGDSCQLRSTAERYWVPTECLEVLR